MRELKDNKEVRCICCSELATLKNQDGIPYCGKIENGGCLSGRKKGLKS